MARKYEQYAKEIPMGGRCGPAEFTAVLDGSFFGWDSISVRYGLIDSCGLLPEETDKMHVHDCDQMIIIMSSDPDDVLNLNAELEFTCGTDGIRHRICVPSVISIPAGTPHFSPLVRSVDRKFYYIAVSFSEKLDAKVTDENAVQGEGRWNNFRDESNKMIKPLHFCMHSPYHYGSDIPQDSGGVSFFVSGNDTGFPVMMGWQTICKPHTLGPRRDDGKHHPHVHNEFDEALFFLSMDPDDPVNLGGEYEICLGEEPGVITAEDGSQRTVEGDQEVYTMTKSSVMAMAKGVYHLPLRFTKADKPYVFFTLSRNRI